MSSSPQAAPEYRTANQFELQDKLGKTKVTYYPLGPGPIVQGEPRGPRLDYSGAEGQFCFRCDSINSQNMPGMGQILCVDLSPTLAFNVCLPQIVMGDTNSQPFTTFCVRSTAASAGATGAQISYEVGEMSGNANIIFLPL